MNIAEGDNSTVIGVLNRELNYIEENGQYIRPTLGSITTENNFVTGNGNLILTGSENFITGHYHEVSNSNYSIVAGFKNIVSNNANTGSVYGGAFVFGGWNYVNNADGTIISGAYHTVEGRCNLICGHENTGLSLSTSIIGGDNNNIKGDCALVCGRFNRIDQGKQSLIIGSNAKIETALDSIIAGYDLDNNNNNSIEAKNIEQSIIQGENIKIGHFNKIIGITTNSTASSISLMTGYTTEQRSYSGIGSGYLVYNKYDSYIEDENTIYYIVDTKYYCREGSYEWEINEFEPSGSTYLGTTITEIEDGSTINNFSIISSVTYNATINSFENYDRLQVCNPVNYNLESTKYYLNNQWNEQEYDFGPFDTQNSLILGKNIEARSNLKACQVFGDNQIVQASYSNINGANNQINGSTIILNGYTNNITGSFIECIGSNNTFQGNKGVCIGDSNSIQGYILYNLGDGNTLTGSSIYNIGNNNAINGRPNTLSIGQYLNTNGEQGENTELLLGKYNALANKLLILGNGITDNDRSNALEIDYDGSQVITLKDTSVTGLGIGKITINQQNIIFESLKANSNQVKETVEFTFEDLKQIKQNSQLPNLDNNSYPTT